MTAKKPKAVAAPAKKAVKATDAKKSTTKAASAPSKRMKKDAPAKKVSSARANAKKVCVSDSCCALYHAQPSSRVARSEEGSSNQGSLR